MWMDYLVRLVVTTTHCAFSKPDIRGLGRPLLRDIVVVDSVAAANLYSFVKTWNKPLSVDINDIECVEGVNELIK